MDKQNIKLKLYGLGKLNGSIKSFRQDKYRLNKLGEKYVKGEIIRTDCFYKFDINGNNIEWVAFLKSEPIAVTYLKYDSENNLICERCEFFDHQDSNFIIRYEYDKMGNKIFEQREWSSPYINHYRYDERNNLIYERNIDQKYNTDTAHNYEYKYDIRGNIIERTLGYGDIEKRIYDDNFTLIETIKYNEEGKIINSSRHDVKDNIIENISSKIRRKYVLFDENKNWRKEVVFNDEGENYLIIRNIEYHSDKNE